MKTQTVLYTSPFDHQHLKGLYYPSPSAKALVVVLHGMAEHQHRYQALAEFLVKHHFDVFTVDHRGHGESLYDGTLKGYFSDENGWERNIADVHAMVEIVHKDHNLPLIIFGHSMGSLIARSYLKRYPQEITGVYLSGSPDQSPLAKVGAVVTSLIGLVFGPKHASPFLTKLSFGSFNSKIPNPKTSMDWLSVDEDNVQRYLKDPLCGFDFTAQAFSDLLWGMNDVYRIEDWKTMYPNCPIHFVSGEADPAYQPGGLSKAVECLKKQGYQTVDFEYIQGMRHEIFNDLSRGQVMEDFVKWLNHILV